MPIKPVKWYQKLATSKGRLEAGAFLIGGEKAVRQVIDAHPEKVTEILTIKELPGIFHDYPQRLITEKQLRSICSTKTPQGTIALVSLPSEIYSEGLPPNLGDKILLLEDIQDPGNVGTLIRTAVAFNYSGVILTEKCADPFSPKCIQSTAGTVLSVWIRRNSKYLEYVDILKEKSYHCISADLSGNDSPDIICHQNKLILALGNEASGLSKYMLNASDHKIQIPIERDNAESLNVAVCGAILMYLSSLK